MKQEQIMAKAIEALNEGHDVVLQGATILGLYVFAGYSVDPTWEDSHWLGDGWIGCELSDPKN